MITFFLAAACLLLLAFALLLPAFFSRHQHSEDDTRRSQNIAIARERLAELKRQRSEDELNEADFAQAREGLESQLAIDLADAEAQASGETGRGRWAGVFVAISLPIAAGLIYLTLGHPSAIDGSAQRANPHPQSATATAEAQADKPLPSVEEMSTLLEQRLQESPEDPKGWFLLGRTYMAQGRYPDATRALRKVRELVGDDPRVLVSLADAIAMANDSILRGEPTELLEAALAQAPEHVQGLWLMGMSRDESGEHEQAIAYWQRVLPLVGDDQKAIGEIHELIASAQQKLGIEPDSAPTQTAVAPAAATSAALTVNVSLDPSMAATAQPGDAVFIYAKALNGPPMPLAALRKTVADLPLTVTLDDSMAMLPAMRLSGFKQVLVGARVSKSGNAISQSGDLIGEVSPVRVGQTERVGVSIAQRVP